VTGAERAQAQPLAQPDTCTIGASRRQRARRNFRRSTDRRPGAGDDLTARILRAHDEAQLLCAGDDMRGAIFTDADGEQRTARRGAETRPSCTCRGTCKRFQCRRVRVPEGESEAERHTIVAQRMGADRIRRRPQRRRREVKADVGDRAPERACTAAGDDLPGTRPACCDHVKHVQRSLDGMLGRDRADRLRDRGISAHTHVKVHASVACHRTQPHIGGNAVEVQGSATIDRDGNLGFKIGGEGHRCDRAA